MGEMGGSYRPHGIVFRASGGQWWNALSAPLPGGLRGPGCAVGLTSAPARRLWVQVLRSKLQTQVLFYLVVPIINRIETC